MILSLTSFCFAVSTHRQMAEIIALSSSVIAIIQLTDRIIGCCKYYIETARDAPSDLRSILIEISALKVLFENLDFLVRCDTLSETLKNNLSSRDGPINGCHRAIKQLEKLFPQSGLAEDGQMRSKKQKLTSTLTVLAWPLKETKARKLRDDLDRHKLTINLVLTTNTA